jgi:hypothetical protein
MGRCGGFAPAEGVAAYFPVGTFYGTSLKQENSRVGGDFPHHKKDNVVEITTCTYKSIQKGAQTSIYVLLMLS